MKELFSQNLKEKECSRGCVMTLGREEAGPLGWSVWESETRRREGLGSVARGQELEFTLSRAGTTTDRFSHGRKVICCVF